MEITARLLLTALLAGSLSACAVGAPQEPAPAPTPAPAEAPEPAPPEPAPAPAPATAAQDAPAGFEGVFAPFMPAGAPGRPGDAGWESVPALEVSLMGQMIAPPVGGGAVETVTVRAVHDGEWLTVLMEWPDATVDDAVGVDRFRDAVAVGFPLGAGLETSPFMGDAEHPVAIWQWTANGDAAARGEGKFDEDYPATEGVWYMPHDHVVADANDEWRGHLAVDSFLARGFGTLERAPSESLSGAGERGAGAWRVVMRRRLSEEGPAFSPGEETHCILAVWDGGAGEVNGRKAVTLVWTPFLLGAEA